MKKKNAFKVLFCSLLITVCTIRVSAAGFRDVPADAWYAESVRFVSDNGIMSGVGGGIFAPDVNATRGMIVTILYRMEKEPAVSGASAFTDVVRGAYYEKAVIWAAKNSIVNGYGATQFGPDDSITREQFAAILYRYCSYKQGDISVKGSLNRYNDAGEISSYAKTAMLWANEKDLIIGTSEVALSPKGIATRAQAAAIITRYAASEDKNDTSAAPNPAEDEIQKTTQPALTVQTIAAKAGERVSVDIVLANNPGILGMTLTVSYDEQSLTLLKAENGSAVKDALTFVSAKSLKSGSSFVWYGTDLDKEQVKDGTVLTLTFEVSGSARGSLPVVLTAVSGDIVDNRLQTVNVLLQSGGIQIK